MTRFNVDGGVHEVPLHDGGGRLWLCGKHAVAPQPEALLAALGAHTIVCLTQEHELADRYPAYVRWLRANEGTAARWSPVHDLGVPDEADARALLDDLAARRVRGDGLVLHCAAGIGRAGTIAAALLVSGGWDVDDALGHVRAARPMAGPEAGVQLDFVRSVRGWRRTPPSTG